MCWEQTLNCACVCVCHCSTLGQALCSSSTLVCSRLSLFRFLLSDRCIRLCMVSLYCACVRACVCVYWVVLKARALKKAVTNRTNSGSSFSRALIPGNLTQPCSAADSWLDSLPTLYRLSPHGSHGKQNLYVLIGFRWLFKLHQENVAFIYNSSNPN